MCGGTRGMEWTLLIVINMEDGMPILILTI